MLVPPTKLAEAYAALLAAGQGTRAIQMLVAPTVDALCCCAVLARLFALDGLRNSAVAVHALVFIDCGAAVDLPALVGETGDVALYVLDSHRPYDPANVRSPAVRILTHADYPAPAPRLADVDDFHEADADFGALNQGIPPTTTVLPRKGAPGGFFSESVAALAHALAEAVGKAGDACVWYAAIGIADQLVSMRIDPATYQHGCRPAAHAQRSAS